MRLGYLILVCCIACPVVAQTPITPPPGSTLTLSQVSAPGTYDLPAGAYAQDEKPVTPVEGRVSTRVWRVPLEQGDTLILMRALRAQFQDKGFQVVFDCATDACGGFDFRYGIEVRPPPEMEVDLNDFRFLSLSQTGETPSHAGILISRTPVAAYIQLIDVQPISAPVPTPDAPLATEELPPSVWANELTTSGRAVLEGLSFESGAARLSDESAAILADLAAFLSQAPDIELEIVGHSDNIGSLNGNIALSQSRAQAVRQALIDEHGIDAARLSASGVGFLAPRAPNDTEAGQALNRRVEIVLR